MLRVSVIGKFSLNTRNNPSLLRLSGVVSSWKKSWNDWSWIASRSGVAAASCSLPKLTLPAVVFFCGIAIEIKSPFYQTKKSRKIGYAYLFRLFALTVKNNNCCAHYWFLGKRDGK